MAASAPKPIKHLGGATPSAADIAAYQYDPPAVPLDDGATAQAILQLQNTLNDVIAHFNTLVTGHNATITAINAAITVFNAHVHTENTASSYTQNATTAVSTTTATAVSGDAGTALTGAGSAATNLFTAT